MLPTPPVGPRTRAALPSSYPARFSRHSIDAMATRRGGNAQSEIEDARSRLLGGSWDTSSVDVVFRLGRLAELLGADSSDEMCRHVVVSAIAALQTFHRGAVVELVNHSELLRERAAESFTEKFSLREALQWLHGSSATFGELVAHTAPCNSVGDMLSRLTQIVGFDFKPALAQAVSPYDRDRADTAPRLIGDVDLLIASLADAFRLRHIFAHEAAPSTVVDLETCTRLFEAVRTWVHAVDGVLWATVYRDSPLTQAEMNGAASRQVTLARGGLAQSMRVALAAERSKGTAKWLRENHRQWRNVVLGWRAQTYSQLDGTMWAGVGASDLADAIRARAAQVNAWLRANGRK
jgi:hypothetical protein